MQRICNIKRVSLAQIEQKTSQIITALTPKGTMNKLKLRFSLRSLFPLPRQLLGTSILLLIKLRFPLLLEPSQNDSSIQELDKNIKQLYQQQIKQSRLINQLDFELFLIVAVKLCSEVVVSVFKDVTVGYEEEQEVCCLLTQTLLGLEVVPTCYKWLQKKYIDEQMYSLGLVGIKRTESDVRQLIDSSGTRRVVTMNVIQSKMQKRRFKTRINRPSIEVAKVSQSMRSQSMRSFRQDLDRSLKVQPLEKVQKKKERYRSLEKRVEEGAMEEKEPKIQTKRKKLIHSQQISSSMKLSLLLQQATHSYSRRGLVIRQSNPSPRLTHRVYQACSFDKQNVQLPSIHECKTPTAKKRTFLQKKTKSYWNIVKQSIRKVNQQMLY